MSTESVNQLEDENVHWEAGNVEKVGVGVSVGASVINSVGVGVISAISGSLLEPKSLNVPKSKSPITAIVAPNDKAPASPKKIRAG